MTHKPPQGIDAQPLGPCICPPGHIGHWEACPAGYIKPASLSEAPNCAHKQLKKQMVGEFVYYVCECGQKFRVEPWDGKVSVLAPPDPRKDLALEAKLEEAKWWYETHIRPWRADDLDMEDVAQKRIAELEQRLAAMRGAKRQEAFIAAL